MTVTGERAITAPDSAPPSALPALGGSEIRRFAESIISLHGRLSFGRLPDAIDGEPLFRSTDTGDGLLTLSLRESQIPTRYMKGILGFRLAQYLRLGWISDELVYQEALYHEPSGAPNTVENIHTVTLDEASGRIVGYIGLVCSLDEKPMPLDSPRRSRFPSESAHHVDLVSRFAEPGLTSHHVFEIKRFVREVDMARTDQRWRVPWHLILGLCGAALADGSVRLVLGDSKEHGALRHFRLIGFDPVVVENTEPRLARSELMWPSYNQQINAKPFVAPLPVRLADYAEVIRSSLEDGGGGRYERGLAARLSAARRTLCGPTSQSDKES
ncbi:MULTISPECIES: hypothetical protein [Kitasatospora]|uniref:Uncharacterized protein n=2 Tax=Kitasatospora TaxID=2063 RepID=A0ABT1IT19_9ACTN|nr:hypothetical protein [Kitasatospora paracochleata]MCP2308272.1 hypothetical protein [Kitasatospora paracochleata]